MNVQTTLKSTAATTVGLLATIGLTAPLHADLKDGMKEGAPALKSIGALAFGPEGILFTADPKAAAIYAISTKSAEGGAKAAKVDKLNAKIAAALGTDAKNVIIEDLVVNPASQEVYVSTSRGRGPDAQPALIKVSGDKITVVSLDKVSFSKAELSSAPEGERQRASSVTDMAWVDGKLAVAGLSNEEFASTLRMLEFPFSGKEATTGVEIYHGAHGKLETRSPIRTLVPLELAGEPIIVASYTCTPLVTIPIKEVANKAKITGKTIAELGNRNRPLDMIDYVKDGKQFILMANSARGIMKIPTEGMDKIEAISERISGKAGAEYETIEGWENITQLAKLDASHAVIIKEWEDESKVKHASFETVALP